MAKNVNSAFDEFNKNIVNLNSDRTSIAISSRDWLFKQLNKLDSKEEQSFPFKYEDKHIKFGSFARKTKIRELDDIDIMFCLTADGAGDWKATDPRIDQDLVTTINQNYEGRALQLIRTLKYWNRHNSSYTMGSYLFEQFVINYIKTQSELSQWIDIDIVKFFNYLSVHIHDSVMDPKGIQGNLNKFTFDQRKLISDKASWAYKKSEEAYKSETQENNQEKAINKWREVYGSNFPKYE